MTFLLYNPLFWIGTVVLLFNISRIRAKAACVVEERIYDISSGVIYQIISQLLFLHT